MAIESSVKEAKELAKDCKCRCKNISVKFVLGEENLSYKHNTFNAYSEVIFQKKTTSNVLNAKEEWIALIPCEKNAKKLQ